MAKTATGESVLSRAVRIFDIATFDSVQVGSRMDRVRVDAAAGIAGARFFSRPVAAGASRSVCRRHPGIAPVPTVGGPMTDGDETTAPVSPATLRKNFIAYAVANSSSTPTVLVSRNYAVLWHNYKALSRSDLGPIMLPLSDTSDYRIFLCRYGLVAPGWSAGNIRDSPHLTASLV
jgi:hypothetical protein